MEAIIGIVYAVIIAVLVTVVTIKWRKENVIANADDNELLAELKYRAFQRKMRNEADAEINAAVKKMEPLE